MRAARRGRRHRDDGVAAIGSAHRLALDRAIALEIVDRHAPARRLNRGDDFFGDRAGVEAGRAVCGDHVERRGEIVERDMVAGRRRASVGLEIDALRRGVARQRAAPRGEANRRRPRRP